MPVTPCRFDGSIFRVNRYPASFVLVSFQARARSSSIKVHEGSDMIASKEDSGFVGQFAKDLVKCKYGPFAHIAHLASDGACSDEKVGADPTHMWHFEADCSWLRSSCMSHRYTKHIQSCQSDPFQTDLQQEHGVLSARPWRGDRASKFACRITMQQLVVSLLDCLEAKAYSSNPYIPALTCETFYRVVSRNAGPTEHIDLIILVTAPS
ncbi:hypothetical protein HD553DRAFT_355505 [Filobasidium floriforme]|uniref:uncharacterized protein n=1 Tax=Filobasidium floriforme TaxID=5210 RepID=UPI001E8DF5D8|nr:uncharacterized protein HD553DRAFT_355505 [Filobasidium floriforme]KAH8084616.1 hypothetical protein HD553DRAFT_355505 [Filobasidium floriforme]